MDQYFVELLQTKGTASALAFYREMIEKHPNALLFSERQINAMGYGYLAEGKTGDAFAMFQLNVEVFPSAFNVYDSQGEAFMLDGQYEEAIVNYKWSLELNPQNRNAEDKLLELEDLQNIKWLIYFAPVYLITIEYLFLNYYILSYLYYILFNQIEEWIWNILTEF